MINSKGPVWIKFDQKEGQFAGKTLWIQFTSFDNKEMNHEDPECAAEFMKSMLVENDRASLADKDEQARLATVITVPWNSLPEHLQEDLQELNTFGEETIIARRTWVDEDGELIPVVVGESHAGTQRREK